jgi:excisionase family DNA binding protein
MLILNGQRWQAKLRGEDMNNWARTQRLHSLQEAADAWHISIHGVRRLVRSGAIPAVNVGARVLVSSDTIDQVIRQGVGTPRPRGEQRQGRRG